MGAAFVSPALQALSKVAQEETPELSAEAVDEDLAGFAGRFEIGGDNLAVWRDPKELSLTALHHE